MDRVARDKEEKFAAEQKASERKAELLEQLRKITDEEKKVRLSRHVELPIRSFSDFLVVHRSWRLQLQEEIAPLTQKIRVKETEKRRLRAQASQEQQGLSEALNQFRGEVKQLRDLTRQIDEFSDSSKPHDAECAASNVSNVLERIGDKKRELESVQPELERATNALNDQERHKKQLQENIELHGIEKRIQQLEKETRVLEEERGSVAGGEVAISKHKEAKERKDELLSKKARIEGRWSEIVEQIRALKVSACRELSSTRYHCLNCRVVAQRKLSSPEYKDVDEQHRIVVIKVETTQIAAEDLKKYGNALDNVRAVRSLGVRCVYLLTLSLFMYYPHRPGPSQIPWGEDI
jgi:DNA repair protein RAD50